MKKTKTFMLVPLTLLLLTSLSGCLNSKKEVKKSSPIRSGQEVNEILASEDVELQVISQGKLKKEIENKKILSFSDPQTTKILNALPRAKPAVSLNKSRFDFLPADESLLVGFPIGLVGEENVFGGVITKVTDKENEALGTLKLTDLPPIHVRTMVSILPNGVPALTLVGCFENCTEDSSQDELISIPIRGVNEEKKLLLLDVASLGKELDLVSLLDPFGEYTNLRAISSETVFVDFEIKTLIFDVKTKMIPRNQLSLKPDQQTTDFTVRWYLKLSSGFNSSFKERVPTVGVGFFQTDRSLEKKITRFSTTTSPNRKQPVHYFIKNVPEEFKGVFSKAINSWNEEFKKILGKELLSYEFIDATDPRAELLVTGDIRYNIIEWDLINKAGYGGLGPSVANQFSGEIMSANVLIQGPTIIKLYKEWFEVSEKARALMAMNQHAEAQKLMKEFELKTSLELKARTQKRFQLKLGKHLEMNIPAQRPDLEDPIKKGHFEIIPENVTYESYMEGYMLEILAHELGHNLGLRHNFKGNLGANDSVSKPGSVSRSVMEYLGRPFRHLNIIGPYDQMAISYGYRGRLPDHLNWFCTDEDVASDAFSLRIKSPECSKSDATSDPFSFLERRLDRILDLIMERKSFSAPVWKISEVKSQMDETITGLIAYAQSALITGNDWSNFFGKEGRPENITEVNEYVKLSLRKKICDPSLEEIILQKSTPEEQALTRNNLSELRKEIAKKSKELGSFTAEELSCL